MGAQNPPATSPFTQTEMVELGENESYSKQGVQWGLRFPDGRLIINFNDTTNYHWLNRMATMVNAKIEVVKGTWTFVPDPPEIDE